MMYLMLLRERIEELSVKGRVSWCCEGCYPHTSGFLLEFVAVGGPRPRPEISSKLYGRWKNFQIHVCATSDGV
jgi:hypothetical protein